MCKDSTKKTVCLVRQTLHHGSELEQSRQFSCRDASVLEVDNAVELAAGHGQTHGWAIGWAGESTQLQCATIRLRNGRAVRLLVERLGEAGWDWHVWVQAGWTWARYGLAETAEHARNQAEQALVGLMRSDTGGTALLGPHCQPILLSQRSA